MEAEIIRKGRNLTVWNFLSIGIGFIFILIITRLLGPEKYGLLTLSLAIMEIGALGLLALSDAVTKYLAESRNKNIFKKGLIVEIIIGLVSGALLFVLSDPLSMIFNKPISLYLKIISVMLFLRAIYEFSRGVYLGFKIIRYSIFSDAILTVSKLVISTMLILAGFEVSGVLLGMIIAFGLTIIYIFPPIFRLKFSRGSFEIKKIILFSSKSVTYYTIRNLFLQLIFIVIGIFLLSKQIGEFNLLLNLTTLPLSLLAVGFGTILFPYFSEYFTKNKRKLNELLNSSLKLVLYSNLILCLLLFMFLGKFINFFFPAYSYSNKSILVFLVGGTFQGFGIIMGSLMRGANKLEIGIKSTIVSLLILAFLSIITIPVLGQFGAVLVYNVAIIIQAVLMFFMLKHELGLKIDLSIRKKDFELIKLLMQ